MKSKKFSDKLAESLQDYSYEVQVNVDELLRISESIRRFNSKEELSESLSEGIMLNINKLASQSLLIPPGNYMVSVDANGKSILFPTRTHTSEETSALDIKSYDIQTSKLLNVWNKVERSLTEEDDDHGFKKDKETDMKKNIRNKTVFMNREPGRQHPIDSQVASAYSTTEISQDDMADKIGVDPSTISRWKTKGKKAGRTPSLAHALELSKITGVPIDSMLSNKTDANAAPKHKTAGSGGGRNDSYKAESTEYVTEEAERDTVPLTYFDKGRNQIFQFAFSLQFENHQYSDPKAVLISMTQLDENGQEIGSYVSNELDAKLVSALEHKIQTSVYQAEERKIHDALINNKSVDIIA